MQRQHWQECLQELQLYQRKGTEALMGKQETSKAQPQALRMDAGLAGLLLGLPLQAISELEQQQQGGCKIKVEGGVKVTSREPKPSTGSW